MTKTFTIQGDRIHNIQSFYNEINRAFMSNAEWNLAPSLDAINDLFYGGFGEIEGNEEIILIWTDFEKNRNDLGLELTKAHNQDK